MEVFTRAPLLKRGLMLSLRDDNNLIMRHTLGYILCTIVYYDL